MTHHPHHEHLVKELTDQLKPVFSKSPHAVYLYLDDEHKSCNKKFADMLGYASPAAWVANQYPLDDVVAKDQKKVIKAYTNASQKFISTTLSASMKTKRGKKIKAEITFVPLPYQGEVFVLHFISPKK